MAGDRWQKVDWKSTSERQHGEEGRRGLTAQFVEVGVVAHMTLLVNHETGDEGQETHQEKPIMP